MQTNNCNVMTQDNGFFDITHTFKVGPSTYHVLGVRKDRPTYKNTYYIFNCANGEHESTNDIFGKSTLLKRPTRATEQTALPKRRPLTAHHTKTVPIDTRTIASNESEKTKSLHPRARTESPKPIGIDVTVMKETLDKALRTERQMLIASFRKEINNKKKVLIRSIKKERQELIEVTKDVNKKDDIIRLLEEQNNLLTKAYDQFVSSTTSSIDTLKQTLIDMLESQHNASISTQELQLTLMQTIEKEVEKIVSKNEEILQSTSAEIDAINELQTTLIQKMNDITKAEKHDDDATLNRLFNEQKQVLTHIVEQQQSSSAELIREAMVDVLSQQKITSINQKEHHLPISNDSIVDRSFQHVQLNNQLISSNTIHSLPHMKSNQPLRTFNQSTSLKLGTPKMADQHLFKVSIRTPEPAHLYAKLVIDGMECSRRLHTLCQRDIMQHDLYNCYLAPPTKDGLYELTIYAKTKQETTYQAAICIRIPVPNLIQSITFPMLHQAFEEHQCILIEPFQRLLRRNDFVLIQMMVPGALLVKICNGDETIELDANEYKNEIVKKKIRVRGDVSVLGCWEKKTDSVLCIFNVV
ncbi:hypothetical protein I4U23_006547 [Adineta vaga]|nr:hypothetical protein I4U23_006547 [Adineta vaga]